MRIFPGISKYCAMIGSGEFLDSPGKGFSMSLMTPDKDYRKGIPTVRIYFYESPDEPPTERHGPFDLHRHAIADLRDWCERTLFALDNPDRYYEETSWREWYAFTAPQRAGFTLNAFQDCEMCDLDEAELS